MKSYAYAQRKGVEEISWEKFDELAEKLSERLAKEDIEIILGIARAGLFPATAVACALRQELYPIRVSRRVNDSILFEHPIWRVDIPDAVARHTVAILDEISDSGETLKMAAARARERGAERVITASLVSHSWARPMPDITALVSDALVIFPWDRQVYMDGKWQINPEIAQALRFQGKSGSAPTHQEGSTNCTTSLSSSS